MQKTFDTPAATSLYVELGAGDVTVNATEVDQTTVTVDGKRAEEVTVEKRGEQIVVIGPKWGGGFFGGDHGLQVHVTLPNESELSTKLGSADLHATGRLGDTRVKTGSGDISFDVVAGDALIESGSGDIEIDEVTGEARIKTGSGDIEIDEVEGNTSISTGSGDVSIRRASSAVEVRSGSGDLQVRDAAEDVSLNTASGDLVVGRMHRGQLQAKNVSGDIRVGIPANIPVWTDISSVTGQVYSDLKGAGQPDEGQDYIEVRAKTVSGDIALEEL